MILQALKNYYDRKADTLPPEGWIKKGIDYVVVLDLNGNFVNLECKQTKEGNKKIAKLMDLPNIGKQSSKHTNSGDDANLLWDNSAFAFGIGNKGKKKLSSFIKIIEDRLGNIEDCGINALLGYLQAGQKILQFLIIY